MLVPTEAGRLVSCLSLRRQEDSCYACLYKGRKIDVMLVLTEAGRLVSGVMLVPTKSGRFSIDMLVPTETM